MISSSSIRWILIALGILFVLSFYFLSGVYASFLIAFLIAYLVNPIVGRLVKRKIPRKYAIALVLVTVFSTLILLGIVIVPKLFAQGKDLAIRIPAITTQVIDFLGRKSDSYFGYNVFTDFSDPNFFSNKENFTFLKPIGGILQGVFSSSFKVVGFLLGFLVIPLLSFYLLIDFPRLKKDFLAFLPDQYHDFMEELLKRLNYVLGGYLRGQFLVSTILSFYYGIAFLILRVDLALVLGLMAGYFNIIPYVGIASILGLTFFIVLIHEFSVAKLIALSLVFVLGMAVEGSILTPRIVGKKVGIGPLTLILSLLAGGELLGLVGMLLAVPFVAVMKVVVILVLEQVREG